MEDDLDDLKDLFPHSHSASNLPAARKRSKAEQLETDAMDRESKKDPILEFLQSHYSKVASKDLFDVSSDGPETGDLSWDEGDLPHLDEHQVWSFNDFMEQYNQLYSWLNQLQEQYHFSKKQESSSPRLAGIRRELESSAARREYFLSSCGRMVTTFPDLGEEVGWRVEHVLAKWDMLTNLKGNPANNMEDVSYIYSDIECDVRCLRKWLKEMEQRIDPLQFHAAASWSTRDIEKKMAEYQVLQKDIESHGKIVKMVLTLCEELSVNPGLYDLHHALKVAKNLERRWHQIWLRSLEWQCLLEQWIQEKTQGLFDMTENGFDTEEEPLNKMPKLSTSCSTPNISPAATLLRRKKRKRWIKSPLAEQVTMEKIEAKDRQKLSSPRANRHFSAEERMKMEHNLNIVDNNEIERPQSETNSYSKMATSESELSISGQSTSRSSENSITANKYLCQVRNNEDQSRTNKSYRDIREAFRIASDNNDNDALTGCDKEAVDNDPLGQSLKKSKQDIHLLANRAELMVLNASCEASDEDDAVQKVTKEISSMSGSSSLPKRRNSEAVRKERKKSRKISCIELSSKDAKQNVPPLDIRSLLSEGSRTQEVDEGFKENEASSEDASCLSARSIAISEYWDQEKLLSERTYYEPIDEEKAKKLINFGDDYSKYIDSMSESDSSILESLSQNAKKVPRRKRKKQVENEVIDESQSESELEDICNVISDSHKKMNSVELLASKFFTEGFIKKENFNEYNGLVEICTQYLKQLIHLLESIDLNDSFVSKKKSREIRFLLHRWENLLNKIKDNISQTETYVSLTKNISSFKEDLEIFTESPKEESTDLESQLREIKDKMMELSNFKSRLFQLNLSVHNFLAELSSSGCVEQAQITMAAHLKEDVLELYTLWENSHHRTSGCLIKTEAALKKLSDIELELVELQSHLCKDAVHLKEKRRKELRSKSGKKGQNSSGDSGISDSSGGNFSDCDMPIREQHLSKLTMMARDLEHDLPANSSALAMISQTLETTSSQLKDLQNNYQKYKTTKSKATKYKGKLCHEKLRKKESSTSGSRRGRYVKMALMINLLLMFVIFLSWLSQPRCCDNYSIMSFSPQLTYINGPPPI